MTFRGDRATATPAHRRLPPHFLHCAPAPDANLVTNGGFETDTSGWRPNSGTSLSRDTSTFQTGTASAKLTRTGRTGDLILDDYRNVVASTIADTSCTASAFVTGPVGKKATIRLREYAGSTRVGIEKTAITMDGTWQPLSVTIDIAGAGHSLGLNVFGSRFATGQSMWVDDVWLTCQAVT